MKVEERSDVAEETEDQKALRELLAGDTDSAPQIDTIPVPPTETDTLQKGIATLRDVPSVEDYVRACAHHCLWGCHASRDGLGSRWGCHELRKSQKECTAGALPTKITPCTLGYRSKGAGGAR